MNKDRFKNPWFWVGIGGVILTATGMEPSMFTSWDALSGAVLDVLKNPFLLGTAALAVLGVFVEPTTKGLTDGKGEEK
ncbi:phage holin [Anaerotignum lactatifermentans]|uniref:phage holin n=1 Tax=Anaerotignum lactatifermentans TaxID=160404 RepID=UPI0026769C8C|nr:phage holin [Anaerotignum lactatifermentans]